jgi:hypothetical protein
LVETEYDPPADSDLGLVNAGFAAVTSLQYNSEVWNTATKPSAEFQSEPLPAASQGDRLSPPNSFFKQQ